MFVWKDCSFVQWSFVIKHSVRAENICARLFCVSIFPSKFSAQAADPWECTFETMYLQIGYARVRLRFNSQRHTHTHRGILLWLVYINCHVNYVLAHTEERRANGGEEWTSERFYFSVANTKPQTRTRTVPSKINVFFFFCSRFTQQSQV